MSKTAARPTPRTAGVHGGLHKTLLLMTSTSLFVPLAGLVSAPILAHTLGASGRGEVAAAVAPNLLLASVATLGLPEALTFHLAKRPGQTRPALGRATAMSLLVGLLSLVAAALALPFLSDGDPRLADLILLATALAVPQLVVNLLRGAAAGRQLWRAVATERVLNSLLRVATLALLALTGTLTVQSAVLVTVLIPLVAAVPYWRLLRPPPADFETAPAPEAVGLTRVLVGFGSRVWVGAVASILLARIGQVLFLPLSDAAQLGLFAVAITVSDTPLIVALAIRDALYGVSSRTPDPEQVAAISRISLLVGFLGCLVLGGTLPWWIDVVFGPGFAAATSATWILLLCSVINVPGFIVAAGLAAWGRPGLRSLGLAVTLAVNLPLFVLLVPTYGAVGAALAGLASSSVSTVFMLVATSRVLETPVHRFLVPTREDLRRLGSMLPRSRAREK